MTESRGTASGRRDGKILTLLILFASTGMGCNGESVGGRSASAVRVHADGVLFNGKVFTANDSQPSAQAIAFTGNRILAVGDDVTILGLADESTRRINLEGHLVVPGFNDAHAHFLADLSAVSPPAINIPGDGPTFAQALAQVQDAVQVAAPDQNILVTIGNAALFDAAGDRFAIDLVAPHNPVILFHFTSHALIINTRAMEVTGLAEDQPDPMGGFYGRVAGTRILDGRLFEYAFWDFARRLRGLLSVDHWAAAYSFDTQVRAQNGYTSAQEIPIGVPADREEAILRAANLKVRVRFICQPLTVDESCDTGFHNPDARITATGVKWISDGTHVERDAALVEPYADGPQTDGFFAFNPMDLDRILRRAMRGDPKASQPVIHALGDRAVKNILDAMGRLANDQFWRSRRLRIEHGDLWQPGDMERAAAKGVVFVQNPFIAIGLTGQFWEPRFGSARAQHAVPLRSALDAGLPLAFGYDFFFPNPFLDIFFAVADPLNPAEAVTTEEAVIALTRTSAYAEFQEHQKGQLRPDFLADLAVLSQDILTVPIGAIPATTSLLTIMDGEVTWDAGVLH